MYDGYMCGGLVLMESYKWMAFLYILISRLTALTSPVLISFKNSNNKMLMLFIAPVCVIQCWYGYDIGCPGICNKRYNHDICVHNVLAS